MICQQYISKVKGASGPPRPSAGTGVPCLLSRGGSPFQAPTLSATPRSPGGRMEPGLRVGMLGSESEFSHFLDTRDLGKCFALSVPQFPRLLMGTIPFTTLQSYCGN